MVGIEMVSKGTETCPPDPLQGKPVKTHGTMTAHCQGRSDMCGGAGRQTAWETSGELTLFGKAVEEAVHLEARNFTLLFVSDTLQDGCPHTKGGRPNALPTPGNPRERLLLGKKSSASLISELSSESLAVLPDWFENKGCRRSDLMPALDVSVGTSVRQPITEGAWQGPRGKVFSEFR